MLFRSVAAFRSDDIDPGTTWMLNDAVRFLFLYTWPPFSAWAVAIAVPIFRAEPQRAVFPLSVGYLNIWMAIFLFPAGLIAFFKTGAFAYNGAIAFYFVAAVFFGWMVAMTAALLASIRAEERGLAGRAGAGR